MKKDGELFKSMCDHENPTSFEKSDNTRHEIDHIGNVLINMDNCKVDYLENVLHVPETTKNLVFVG